MHDLLFERAPEWGGLPAAQMPEVLTGYAQELGLDRDRFAQDLENHTYEEQVQSSYSDAMSLGLTGTPSFIINGHLYPSDQLGISYEGLETFIQMVLESHQYDSPPPQVIDPGKEYAATIRTSKGDIVVELFADQAPANVNSFAFLAQDGWYDGQAFFYVEPDFVAQSGDPTNGGLRFLNLGYYCNDETSPDLTFDQGGMLALYTRGPNHNSSLFFITYTPQPDFNGIFTIIGRITEGMDVAESLTQTQPGPDQPEPDVIETILIEEQ